MLKKIIAATLVAVTLFSALPVHGEKLTRQEKKQLESGGVGMDWDEYYALTKKSKTWLEEFGNRIFDGIEAWVDDHVYEDEFVPDNSKTWDEKFEGVEKWMRWHGFNPDDFCIQRQKNLIHGPDDIGKPKEEQFIDPELWLWKFQKEYAPNLTFLRRTHIRWRKTNGYWDYQGSFLWGHWVKLDAPTVEYKGETYELFFEDVPEMTAEQVQIAYDQLDLKATVKQYKLKISSTSSKREALLLYLGHDFERCNETFFQKVWRDLTAALYANDEYFKNNNIVPPTPIYMAN